MDSLHSPQEQRILELIADGLTNRQIGAEMHLAEKTVENYVSSLLRKLGFERRTEAAVYAAERRTGRPPAPATAEHDPTGPGYSAPRVGTKARGLSCHRHQRHAR